jgi:UDP-hydrolysing UDP-N-acetyl-D-glucosamine 2-epimerase
MKKICVVSGTRADYGLLFWTMKEIQKSSELKLQVIATCMHLDSKFGDTWNNFESDGFPIDKKVSLGELLDSRLSVINQVSTGIKGFYEAYKELKSDLVLILGDRYEMMAAAQAALFANIPIAHIHGGEVTEGAFDDAIRHTITKMSSYHFASTETYRKRIIQMGENPERVINVGAVGLENIRKLDLMSKEQLEKDLNFKLKEKNFLITYHPVTQSNEDATDDLLKVLVQYPDVSQIITLPNSDPGHSSIINKFEKYAQSNSNVYLAKSLGSLRYLSVMKLSNVVIGNSSSGIIEAPFLGVPTLNIGNRQKGRLHDVSVINSSPEEIGEKIKLILGQKFQVSSLYGDGNNAAKVTSFLNKADFKVKSGFYDL